MQFALTQLIVTALLACSAMVHASPIVTNEVGDEAINFPAAAAGLEAPAVNTHSARQYLVWSVSNIWADADKSGAHETLKFESLSHCYNMSSNWNDVISSLEVLDGATCTYYVHADCKGSSIVVRGPGSLNHLTPGIINDQISSLKCAYSKPI